MARKVLVTVKGFFMAKQCFVVQTASPDIEFIVFDAETIESRRNMLDLVVKTIGSLNSEDKARAARILEGDFKAFYRGTGNVKKQQFIGMTNYCYVFIGTFGEPT